VQQIESSRHVELPNSVAYYSGRQAGNDLVFLHALEPHASAEDFVESILELTQRMGVRRYCQIGAFYGASPHTRPLRCSGRASDPELQDFLVSMGLTVGGGYQGPTSIMALTVEMLRARGISTMNLSVQLPHYARLDEDYRGQETLMRILDRLYNLGLDLEEVTKRANTQYFELDKAVSADPEAKVAIRQLEQFYDDDHGLIESSEELKNLESITLPPSVEQLLKDLESGKDPRIID
jgi:predicted ATP-grasp superfamily ATP-dependent carboligase